MGADLIKDFLARLGFQVDEASYARFNSSLASASMRVAALGLGIQAAAAGLYAFVYKVALGQSELLELSQSTGVAVGTLEELNYVAEQTGASHEALASSLKGLQQGMAASTIGQGPLATFQRLGIKVKDATGRLRDTSDVLFEIGERIKGMDRGKQEMFLGQLGVSRELVKMLTQDVGGLREAYRQMYAAAGVDAQKAAEASRGFVNEVNSIKTVFGLLSKSVGLAMIGKMQGHIQNLRKGIMENFTKISRVVQTIINVFVRLAAVFGAMTTRIMRWIGDIVDWFSKLDGSTQNVILAVLGFAAAWKFLNLSFLATPLGMLISGLAAVALLADDLQTYMEGGESLIDWGPWVDQIMAVMDALRPLMDALGRLWDMLKGPLMEGFRAFGQDAMSILGALLGAVISFVTAVVQLFQGDFSGALQSVLNIFQRLMDIVLVVAGRIGEFLSSSWGAVKSLFGDDEDNPTAKIPFAEDNPERPSSPVLGPTPALAAAAAGNTSNVNLQSNTTINVDGAGDPTAVGRSVGGQQGRVNADLVRHARGAAR